MKALRADLLLDEKHHPNPIKSANKKGYVKRTIQHSNILPLTYKSIQSFGRHKDDSKEHHKKGKRYCRVHFIYPIDKVHFITVRYILTVKILFVYDTYYAS